MATVEGVLNFPMTDETHPRRRPTAEEVPASDGNEGSDVALEQSSRPDPVQSVVLVPFQLVFEGEGRNRRAGGCFLPLTPSEPGAFEGSGLGSRGRLCVPPPCSLHILSEVFGFDETIGDRLVFRATSL